MDNCGSALDESLVALIDKPVTGVSAGMALILWALSGWMIYLFNGFQHLNRVTDQVDCIVIFAIFLCKSLYWRFGSDSQFRHDLLGESPKEASAAKKLDDLYSGFVHIFLDTLVIIRFFSWIEHLNASSESMNVKFCCACIGVTALELLFTLQNTSHLLFEALSSVF
ncbi:hypothetical protein CFAM422_008897 [Trichoderma lentiforme]|uniref:Uncharacterized protein n=1 Tax=Trichoderma lentiforme TaxID=1567552 RepID=A0A9P4XB28_9HYPO|nr:hypothetical protein CFAM422_008897 [Trichoderma lentiforme]